MRWSRAPVSTSGPQGHGRPCASWHPAVTVLLLRSGVVNGLSTDDRLGLLLPGPQILQFSFETTEICIQELRLVGFWVSGFFWVDEI